MDLTMLLQMAADGLGDRVILGSRSSGLTAIELAERAGRAASFLAPLAGSCVGLIDLNSEAVPVVFFGAALAGKSFVPLNYRLTDNQLRALVHRIAPSTVIVGEDMTERLGAIPGIQLVTTKELLDIAGDRTQPPAPELLVNPESIAVLLYTSGTTGEPKAAVLRHRNLAAYVLSTVEFAGAGEDEALLVSVPPYHIAGVSSVLTSTYGGRRAVYLPAFDPDAWVDTVQIECITHAMVVPTMLNRILQVIEDRDATLPSLQALSYGGGPMPVTVIERAIRLLPHVNFVNAYGLTETSSTIALLGPEDHRTAFSSTDPGVRCRLGSVGRPLPTVEVSIRDETGAPVPPYAQGEIWVRGAQVSGEYLGHGSVSEQDWFCTRDAGHLDEGGFLYIHGRLDDVIVRGGENISPGEIEEVLLEHPAVAAAAVVGIPDREWGEQIAAAVVLTEDAAVTEDELRCHVQTRLRSTRTPHHIQIRADLPFNDTGKLLRRALRSELAKAFPT